MLPVSCCFLVAEVKLGAGSEAYDLRLESWVSVSIWKLGFLRMRTVFSVDLAVEGLYFGRLGNSLETHPPLYPGTFGPQIAKTTKV